MRETVSEYGLILAALLVAGIMLTGAFAIFGGNSDVWNNFVELFIEAAYGC